MVRALICCGLKEEQMAIISPFRAQLKQINLRLNYEKLEVYSIDKYQGKDRDCVILSFVKSNDVNQV